MVSVAHQAPLSVGLPRQEDWSGLPFSSPGDLPDPEIEPTSPALQVDSLLPSHQGKLKHETMPTIQMLTSLLPGSQIWDTAMTFCRSGSNS